MDNRVLEEMRALFCCIVLFLCAGYIWFVLFIVFGGYEPWH
jgi:hypothetical protein